MKHLSLVLSLCCLLAACTPAPRWELVWEENFDGSEIDTTVWSRIPRGTADWQNTLTDDPRCYALRDGRLVLRGIVNPDPAVDTAAYLTGGVWTKGKHAFEGGRVEIRARFGSARGAWPAIWMIPFDEAAYPYPTGGEIDIMEHLNFDSLVYQTVHSNYTLHLGGEEFPPRYVMEPIDPGAFHVYGVEFTADTLFFAVDGRRTHAYPRIETEKEGQFPFNIPYQLLLDMQLGGGWVGRVDPADLPVEMEIDWVRHFRLQ